MLNTAVCVNRKNNGPIY